MSSYSVTMDEVLRQTNNIGSSQSNNWIRVKLSAPITKVPTRAYFTTWRPPMLLTAVGLAMATVCAIQGEYLATLLILASCVAPLSLACLMMRIVPIPASDQQDRATTLSFTEDSQRA